MSNALEAYVSQPAIDFLWLELTNRCNLECVHCYSDSSPRSGGDDLLDEHDYRQILREAADLGCRQVQFIGGEPTLNKALPELISTATAYGYSFIEVYSNLVSLSVEVQSAIVRHGVRVATSVYSATPDMHDAVTGRHGSHVRTISNLRKLVSLGVQVRVGVIIQADSAESANETKRYLHDLGVVNVSSDHVREFGRGDVGNCGSMEKLCGSCAGKTLCITPTGAALPCIMSRAWPLGSVKEHSLQQITISPLNKEIRASIQSAVSRRTIEAICVPKVCPPSDVPCQPNCNPNAECIPCRPKG